MLKSASKRHVILTLAGIVPLFSVLSPPPVEAQSFAYITNSTSPPNNVFVIDVDPGSATFNTVVGAITVGNSPTDVAVTPDGSRAYVANSNVDTVSVIDTATNTVPATIGVGDGPFGIAITPDGTRAYVSNVLSDNVLVIDTDVNSPSFNSVVDTVGVGDGPDGVAITPDGTRAYVSNTGPVGSPNGTVSVIDTDPTSVTFHTVIATVPIGINPRGVAITPDGKHAYVTTDFGQGTKVIDTDPTSATFNTVIATVVATGGSGNGEGTRIAITPDGSRAYVTIRSISCLTGPAPTDFSRCVRVIDSDPTSPSFNTVVAEIAVGARPQGIAITPDGKRAYTAIRSDGVVSVIDTDPNSPSFHTLAANIPVGGVQLFGVGFAPALTVAIDIKPGSFPNSINLGSGGNVPVAIFSTAIFDATTVDPLTVTLASAPVKLKGNGTPQSSLGDVNGDGFVDLVVHVDTAALELSENDEVALLTARTTGGKLVRGKDTVRVVP